MRKIAICDSSCDTLETMRRILAAQYGKELQIATYLSGRELLRAWQKDERKKSDIIILDVRAEEDNGISIAKQVQEVFGNVKTIFSTGSLECAGDIFEANPVYLLAKPIKKEKLLEAVDRAIGQIEEGEAASVTLISKSFIARVKAEDIWYVESERRVLTVHTKEEDIRVNMKLGDLEERLPEFFVRVHQSYLVNMKQIRVFSARGVELTDGRVIPASRPRYAKAKDIFLQFLGEKVEE